MTDTAADLWSPARAVEYLAVPHPGSDKYGRGVLGVRIGSSAYPGAAVLGVEAAWRTGIGLVRFASALDDNQSAFALPTPAAAVLTRRPETVFVDGASRPRCDAWLLGSGTDPSRRSFAERAHLRALIGGDTPLVVDAGALAELLDTQIGAPIVLTPHRGEFESLWRGLALGALPSGWPESRGDEAALDALVTAASTMAERLGATVLLKGSRTIAATPGGFLAVSGPATPWLATAGTGDVLGGILGALVATHGDAVRSTPELLGPLAISAASLHDAAGRAAAGDPLGHGLGHPIAALDVAAALPRTIDALRTER